MVRVAGTVTLIPAVVIGDAIRLHLNPGGLPWDRLQASEKDKWRKVGEVALRSLWALDL